MKTIGQQGGTAGLIGRLRQALGPAVAFARPPVSDSAMRVEDLPGLLIHVAADGAILDLSRELAATLGDGDPAKFRGRPIAAYLPSAAPGTPLAEEVRAKGKVRDIPVKLLDPAGEIVSTGLLSACIDGVYGTRGSRSWIGCLTLAGATQHPPPTRTAIDRELMEGMRAELMSQLDLLPLQFPVGGEGDARAGARSLARLYLGYLPRLEAILALNTPPAVQVLDAKASIAELCLASGRLLEPVGTRLLFDAAPRFPLRIAVDGNRLRTCLSLLFGAASVGNKLAEIPSEIIVHLRFEASGFLGVEIAVWPAAMQPAPKSRREADVELAKALAESADGAVSTDYLNPDCTRYLLRFGVTSATETEPAGESAASALAVDHYLHGVRVLLVGPGEGRRRTFAKWIERQHAVPLHCATPSGARAACNGVPPEIAVLDLSVCREVPEFLREVPLLGLRSSLIPAPEWCDTFIDKPVLEVDLIEAISSLQPGIVPAEWGRQKLPGSGAARILAVDDNPVNQRIMQKILARLGHEVDLASNGLEALAALRQRPHDAVLMDWEMPIMDGLEATAAIRDMPEPLRRIPIIAVTAHALDGDREICLQGGMDDYLSKPVKVDALSRTLDVWLPRSPRLLGREP